MLEELQQITKEQIAKLPKESQDAINSFDWGNIVAEIGKKYLLDEDEITDLQTETLLVLIGLEYGEFYAQNIENEVGTSKNEADKIAEEAYQKIFLPISDILVEKIKRNEKVKNPNLEQSIDFILSGGDYSAFLEDNRPLERRGSVNPPSLKEIKDNLVI